MGAVVIMYRDNLAGLVITPQIRDIMNGNSALIPSGNNANNNINNNNLNTNDNGSSVAGGLITPVFVGAQVDSSSRTFTVTVNVTNNFGYDFTVNSLNATVESSQDHYLLGTVSLVNPITIPAGETRLVAVSGYWTQDAENHISTSYPGATSIKVDLINTAVDVNGIIIQSSQPIDVGSIPIS